MSRLRRTSWKSLDHARERCSDAMVKPDITRCITNYIETNAGCTLPVQGANVKDMILCQNTTSIHKFLELNRFTLDQIKYSTASQDHSVLSVWRLVFWKLLVELTTTA